MEVWLDIAGHEGRYQVSNLGRVRSVNVRGGGRVLRPSTTSRGYLKVSLRDESTKKTLTLSVHRTVLTAFVAIAPSDTHQGNHKDGDKTNNRVSNLEWMTGSANIQHSYDQLGRKPSRGALGKPSQKRKPVMVECPDGHCFVFPHSVDAVRMLRRSVATVQRAASVAANCGSYRVRYV